MSSINIWEAGGLGEVLGRLAWAKAQDLGLGGGVSSTVGPSDQSSLLGLDNKRP